MNLAVKLILIFSFCLPTIALAELPEQVRDDFAVVDGYVVMPINDKYIVDLNASDKLRVGDILTLVRHGAKILHPVTKEVVGSVEEAVGFLQVTRILSGYSYAEALNTELKIANGALVKRFEQVPAFFAETTAEGDKVMRQVKAFLPQLEWLEDSNKDRALLIFTLKEGFVVVTNSQGVPLHKYKVTDEQELADTKANPQPALSSGYKPKPKPLQQLANSVMGVFTETPDERFAEIDAAIIRQKQTELQGIWMGPNLSGSASAMIVADLDGDGLQETAVVLDNKIVIARITDGKFNQLAEVEIPVRLQGISFDALDINKDGRAELYLTAMNKSALASFVVELKGDSYERVIENVNWFLRVVNLPDHQERVLIGQEKGSARVPYSGQPFLISRDGNRLVKGAAFELPKPMNLFSFVPFKNDRNEINYAHLTAGDYLKVFSEQGVDLWESADYFGGSETWFYPRPEETDEILAPARMRPRLIRTFGNEILAVQNDGQRLTQNYRKFKKSRIVSLAWNGFALAEQWRTSSQRGYLADFALADADNDGTDELVLAVKFKHKGLVDPARSAVVIYELE